MTPSGHGAKRTCLGCRQVRDQGLLVRFVLSPDGELLADYRRRLPGRGAYTCIDRGCVEAAVSRRQFDRAFKGRNRTVDGQTLVDRVADQIRERIVNLLGMTRKSGQAVTGSNAVLTALKAPEEISLVLLAEDVSSGIADKVGYRAKGKGVPVFRLFSKALLGKVTGKSERSVVAIKSGPLAETIKTELLRYEHSVGES